MRASCCGARSTDDNGRVTVSRRTNMLDPQLPTSRKRGEKAGSASVQRPQRWDEPFCRDMAASDVDHVLGIKPFCEIDASKFPSKLPLRGLIKNDCRLARYRCGELIIREGDYGTSAFYIISGTVRVVLEPPLPATKLGRRASQRKGFLGAIAQLWRNPPLVEARDVTRYPASVAATGAIHHAVKSQEKESASGGPPRRSDAGSSTVIGSAPDDRNVDRIFLQDMGTVLERHRTDQMSVYEGVIKGGNLFGEIGALGRVPRSATVFADSDVELLEIRWQGLRDIMRSTPAIRTHVEQVYRDNMLNISLRSQELFDKKHLSDEALQELADESRFEMYGQFDWYGPYRKIVTMEEAERVHQEPVIAQEGTHPKGVAFILSGFARLSRHFLGGEQTTSYLGADRLYGLEEVFHNWRHGDNPLSLQYTLRAVGYVTVLFVPSQVLEKYVFPNLPPEKYPQVLVGPGEEFARAGGSRSSRALDTGTLEFLVNTRVINGTATMVIDLDRCTRCDDCVRACATTHENNPRFVRHGIRHGSYMIANACMHCADPVCMLGCPTGAIHRVVSGGQIVINDLTCIGCKVCATNCPYENIRMVEIRGADGRLVEDREKGGPILKATKCDLCVDQPSGPACQRACPHDALIRLNTNQIEPSAGFLNR